MPALFDDPDRTIRLMTATIRNAQANRGWVSFTRLARLVTGSDEHADSIRGLAGLDQYKEFFCKSRNEDQVKLSEEGIRFANDSSADPPQNPDGFGQQIGFAVRRYAAQLDAERIPVQGCLARIPVTGGRILHALKVPCSDHYLASDTPVRYQSAAMDFFTRGRLVGQDLNDQVLYVALDREVMPTELPGQLLVDRAFLLTKLADKVERLETMPPRFALERTGGNSIEHANSVELATLLQRLPTPWTKILWGPPGGGKTHGIGFLAANLLRNDPGERILMVAPSNKAVDVAFLAVYRQCKESNADWISARRFFRFGYPRENAILERPELLGPTERDQLSIAVRQRNAELAQAERNGATSETLAFLRAELLASQELLKQAVSAHVLNAKLVATTTALSFSGLGESAWSTVIVDEVTMVPPAVLVFLASLATKRLLFAGDPLQLGPVFENSGDLTNFDRHWMAKDIFERSEISSWQGHIPTVNLNDDRLARITKQRRCSAELWSHVTHLYRNVETEIGVTGARRVLLDLPPSPGAAVPILDTSSTTATCSSASGSWKNEETAALALEVARTAIAESSTPITIAIISPYRAQVRLIQNLLRDEKKGIVNGDSGSRIDAGTVHQFQGSEADLVVFDLVDGPGRNQLGALLTGPTGLRLLNVAVTRSKGKVVVIANVDWCQRVNIQQSNPLLHSIVVEQEATSRISVVPSPVTLGSFLDGTESPIESNLLNAMQRIPDLRSLAIQHQILDATGLIVSRADFAFPSVKLAVYCDGRKWHCVENRWQRDLRQRNRLASLGWAFLAYSGRDICDNADRCASQIAKVHADRLKIPQ